MLKYIILMLYQDKDLNLKQEIVIPSKMKGLSKFYCFTSDPLKPTFKLKIF